MAQFFARSAALPLGVGRRLAVNAARAQYREGNLIPRETGKSLSLKPAPSKKVVRRETEVRPDARRFWRRAGRSAPRVPGGGQSHLEQLRQKLKMSPLSFA